ncbi:MAG: amidohydrolase [Bacteroidales bacterium]|jgi:predicted amidohydrolase YtcJ|nr:amidohydrolase [Bacteroidales bacterium]
MKKMIYLTIITSMLLGCKQPPKEAADTIYHGGDIITMETESPEYAEAVATKAGKILFVGTKDEAMKLQGKSTNVVDLQGQTMLPGFVDAHSHLWISGLQALAANLLPPPDDDGSSIDEVIRITKEWADKNPKAIGKAGWIIGFGYDDAQLAEKRHPVAEELDKISTEYPVILIHQSSHLGALNSKALEMAGITADTKDPAGGVIRRKEGSQEPDGVLEEMAFFGTALTLLNTFDPATNEVIAKAGQKAYAKYGFTTAQEGRASEAMSETWKNLAEKGELFLDVAAYVDLQAGLDYLKKSTIDNKYKDHYRIAGVKFCLDGSPQGKTAWLTKPYKIPPAGQPADYRGYPAFEDESILFNLVDTAFKYNWQVLAHTNGDASSDQFIRSISQAANMYGNNDRRSVMIHAQTVRDDQLDSMKNLKIIPSFFGMHTYYWGDWHRDETLGEERAFRISPAVSAMDRGMIFTQHNDAPVALPSSTMILHSVVNRVSRSGQIIGPDERITAYDALKSMTKWSAYQYFEEDTKGTLKAGKLADFVILDKNPLKVEPMQLMNIEVMETIKEDKTIFRK